MIKLFGAAINQGQTYGKSVSLAPKIIRSYLNLKKNKYIDYNDHNDYNKLSHTISDNVKSTDFSMIFGGDHSISVSTISSIKKIHSNLKVLWIDAHGDLNNMEESPSGNMHGMPMAFLLGREKSKYECLTPNDIAYIGVRDLDPLEKKYIIEKKIKCIPMPEYIDSPKRKIYDSLNSFLGSSPVHISLDIDSCDSNIAMGTGVPVPNGFSSGEICSLVKNIFNNTNVVSMELVEYFSEFDKNNETLDLIRKIMLNTKIESIM